MQRPNEQPKAPSPAFSVPNLLMNRLVEVAELGAAQEKRAETAESQALTDRLTGLPNRRAAEEEFNRLSAASQRHNRKLSIVSMDLDHFKSVNDTRGHAYGDEVLKEVGALLKQQQRKGDMAARWGGEEFMLLLPDTDEAGALVLAERLRDRLDANGTITASLGVAEFSGNNDETINKADDALYKAKATGRNRVVAFSETQDAA